MKNKVKALLSTLAWAIASYQALSPTPVFAQAPDPLKEYSREMKKRRYATDWSPWKVGFQRSHIRDPHERKLVHDAQMIIWHPRVGGGRQDAYRAAADLLGGFKEKFPASTANLAYPLYLQAECLYRAGDRPAAIRIFKTIAAEYAADTVFAPAALYYLVKWNFENGDVKEAMAALKTLTTEQAYSRHPLAVKATRSLELAKRLELDFSEGNYSWNTLEFLQTGTRDPLRLLFLNEYVDLANRDIVNGLQPSSYGRHGRCEALLRIYLTPEIRARLTPEAKKVIEDFALYRVSKKMSSLRTYWEAMSSENHFLNNRRIYYLSLIIVRMAPRYGPKTVIPYHPGRKGWYKGKMETTVEERYQAWTEFWKQYIRNRAMYGVDAEVAQNSSYGLCTFGAYLDIHDLCQDEELRRIAKAFLDLYWAEIAAEFESRNGERALAATRNYYYWKGYWGTPLLYAYNWHFRAGGGYVNFLVSPYRPPEIVTAIASNPDRGEYLATSRRCGMNEVEGPGKGYFDENNNSHIRRDVYYTPDYTLSTIAYAPHRFHDTHITLTQTMGAILASDTWDTRHRIVLISDSHKGMRTLNGITGTGVSIIAYDLRSQKADGVAVFLSKGLEFTDDRFASEFRRYVETGKQPVEIPESKEMPWVFARGGDGYAAVCIPGGYSLGGDAFYDKRTKETKPIPAEGYKLYPIDKWAPVILQMGRAKDYKSFAAFQKSVKENKLTYKDNKVTYISEAGQKFEYWGKSRKVPRIDGKEFDYNPAKAYSSPYLSMAHNEEKAVIRYPGYDDVVLDFSLDKTKKRPVLLASYSGEVVDFLPKAYWTYGDPIEIKIIKATFGFEDKRFDVTERLSEIVATKRNYGGVMYFDKSFAETLDVSGTPFYQTIKTSPQSKRDLSVTYELGGKQKTKVTLEVKRGGRLVFD